MDDQLLHAVNTGKKLADEVIDARNSSLLMQSNSRYERLPKSLEQASSLPQKYVDALGIDKDGEVLVAEGDSWFEYPWNDVLSMLEENHGYDVEEVATPGHRIQDMAYDGSQLRSFTRKIEKVIRRSIMPSAILLSGGGNDIAGDEFAVLLNNASAPNRGLNQSIVSEIINKRIMNAYVTIISAVTEVCKKRIGQTVPILMHGYDYAVPDGRGYWLFGPWLEPGFSGKGYNDMEERKLIVKDLIDQFNEMLGTISRLSGFNHVIHVDIRDTLPNDSSYKSWWDNELHPTKDGYEIVARKFADALA